MRKPATTGWLRSREKKLMVCGLPSSRIWKSFFSRLEMKRPLSSVTVTGTITSFTSTFMAAPEVSGWSACDGCCDFAAGGAAPGEAPAPGGAVDGPGCDALCCAKPGTANNSDAQQTTTLSNIKKSCP